MMELRCIFWNFDLWGFFGLNSTGNKGVVLLTKLLQRIFLSYLKYKIKIIERIGIYFLANSILIKKVHLDDLDLYLIMFVTSV